MKQRLFLLALCIAVAEPVAGQALGGGAPSTGVEVGWITQMIRRDLSDAGGGPLLTSWGRGALAVKVAPRERIEFVLSGATWYEGASDRFPTRRYRRSTLGLVGSARLWRVRRSEVRIAVGGHAALDFDESSSRYHKRHNRIFAVAVVNQGVVIARQEGSLWLGPTYLRDVLYEYPGSVSVQEYSSKNKLALTLGGDVLLARHIRPYLQGTVAERFGWEWGVAYRF